MGWLTYFLFFSLRHRGQGRHSSADRKRGYALCQGLAALRWERQGTGEHRLELQPGWGAEGKKVPKYVD